MKGKKNIAFIILTIIMALLIVLLFFNYAVDGAIYDDAVFLRDDWEVQVNEKVQNNVNLDTFSFPAVVQGDKIVYQRKLPDVDIMAPCLRIYASHCIAMVYVDDELIYSFGEEYRGKGKMIGGGYHWIPLPDDFQNKMISICYDVVENNVFSNLLTPVLQGGDNALADFLKEYRLVVYIGVFLIIFGCGSFVISILLIHYERELHNLLWIAMFSFCVGLWNICNTGVIQVVSSDFQKNIWLEYMSLYLGTIPLLFFYWEVKKEYRSLRKAFRILMLINILFPITTVLFHLCNVVHICETLRVYHIILVCDIGWGIFVSVRKIKSQKFHEKLLLVGIGSMSVFIMADIIMFNLQKYTGNTAFTKLKCLSAIGALLLIISLVASYCARLVSNYFSKTERELLEKMAYSDALTGLFNRQMFDKEMTQLKLDRAPFVMIVFDLNNLKYANDTWGHTEGDQLICCFADCLQMDIGKYGLVARTGGDEFAVLLKDYDIPMAEKLVNDLLSHMERINKQEEMKVQLSAAYGMASSEECSMIDAAYKLADDRMYVMKVNMKKENPNLHIRT